MSQIEAIEDQAEELDNYSLGHIAKVDLEVDEFEELYDDLSDENVGMISSDSNDLVKSTDQKSEIRTIPSCSSFVIGKTSKTKEVLDHLNTTTQSDEAQSHNNLAKEEEECGVSYSNFIATPSFANNNVDQDSEATDSFETTLEEPQTNDGSCKQGCPEEVAMITTLVITNIQWWTSDADLEIVASEFGKVKGTRFPEERATGKSKGMCEMEFFDHQSACKCKHKMNGFVFNGKPCVVEFATIGNSPFAANAGRGNMFYKQGVNNNAGYHQNMPFPGFHAPVLYNATGNNQGKYGGGSFGFTGPLPPMIPAFSPIPFVNNAPFSNSMSYVTNPHVSESSENNVNKCSSKGIDRGNPSSSSDNAKNKDFEDDLRGSRKRFYQKRVSGNKSETCKSNSKVEARHNNAKAKNEKGGAISHNKKQNRKADYEEEYKHASHSNRHGSDKVEKSKSGGRDSRKAHHEHGGGGKRSNGNGNDKGMESGRDSRHGQHKHVKDCEYREKDRRRDRSRSHDIYKDANRHGKKSEKTHHKHRDNTKERRDERKIGKSSK